MKQLVERFQKLERSISGAKGDFWLFALFLREDAVDRWDLLVSAPWTQDDPGEALRFLASTLQKEFQPGELEQLSRIVLIDASNPALAAINSAVRVEHDVMDIQDSMFNGLPIKHAFIISSRSPGVQASALAG